MSVPQINVYENGEALAQAATTQFIELAQRAINESGRFSVVLAGGSTPKRLHELLADKHQESLDWSKIFIFFGDERFVPPYDAESNYGMADESMLSKLPIPEDNIFPYVTLGVSPQEAAHLYEAELNRFFENDVRFDLILLGMGPDGHTASLFPDHALTKDSSGSLVLHLTDSPKPPPTRLSLSFRAFNSARTLILLAAGESKNNALKRVQKGETLPIAKLEPQGDLIWMLDEAAASGLSL